MNINPYTFEVFDIKLNRAYQFKSLNNIKPTFGLTKPDDRDGLYVRVYCYYDMLYEITLDEYLNTEPSLQEIINRKPQYLT